MKPKDILIAKDFNYLREGVWAHRFSHDSVHEMEIVLKFEDGEIEVKLYDHNKKAIGEANVSKNKNSKGSSSPVEGCIKEINSLYQLSFPKK